MIVYPMRAHSRLTKLFIYCAKSLITDLVGTRLYKLTVEYAIQIVQVPEARNLIFTDGCVHRVLALAQDNLFIVGALALTLAILQVGYFNVTVSLQACTS